MKPAINSAQNLEQLPLTHLQLRPQRTDLSVGIFLGYFAVGLKADN